MIVSPLVVSHYAQNMHTEVQLNLAPPAGGGGGGFFASGLFRSRQPSRPRAYSMLPLTNSTSQDEIGQERKLTSAHKKHSKGRKPPPQQKYYPLSQEDTLELLLLLNQVFIASDADIVRRMASATRATCPPPLRRPSHPPCEIFNSIMAPISVKSQNRRFSTLVTVSERVVLRDVSKSQITENLRFS
ncbi:unnamed protein product [Caenorhabditis bovis]|uniref:Uncharacterized protein n=1 Tax=Caenorhabditis bovis TaxID=2654633 RepID=A0A8S1F8T4_9PELO|nr:unnamed protein product [Caenorhabditis bovis]